MHDTPTYLCVGGDCDGSRVAESVWRIMQRHGGVVGDHDRYVEQSVTLGRASVVVLIPESLLRDDELVARLVSNYWPSRPPQRHIPT